MFLADFLPSSAANASGGLPSATTTLMAGEAVQKGDLVVQAGDQLAYWAADPNVPGASARSLALTSDAYQGNAGSQIAAAAGTTPVGASTIGALANGNMVVAGVASTGALSGFPFFSIYTPVGVLVAGPVKVAISYAGSPSGARLSIAALPAGGFAIGAAHASAGAPGIAVFDNNGAAVGAPVLLEAASVYAYDVRVTPLQNGGFAAAWYTVAGGSGQAKLAFYSAAGVQQSATIVLGTNAGGNGATVNSYGEVIRLVTLLGGNVGVSWISGNGTLSQYTLRYAIYSQAGAVVSADAPTGVVGGYANSQGRYTLNGMALTDGGFGITAMLGQRMYAVKFTAAGVVVGTPTDITGGDVGGFPRIRSCAITGGGFFYSYSSSTGTNTGANGWGVFNGDMTQNVTYTLMNVNGAANGSNNYAIPFLLQNGDVNVLVDSAGTAMYGVRYGLVGATWAPRDTGVALSIGTYTPAAYDQSSGTGAGAASPLVLPLPDTGSVAGCTYVMTPLIASQVSQAVQLVNAVVQKRSFVGVAQAAAAKGAAVVVQVLGAIATRLTFAKPVLVDQTAAAIPGQKASLIGNAAILKGVQP